MKKILSIFLVTTLFLLVILSVGSCAAPPVEEEAEVTPEEETEVATEEEVKFTTITEGVLTIGSDIAYPPFENVVGEEYVGFDIDMGKEIAKRLGLEAEFVNTAWDGIFPALIAHKFDIVMSAVTITPERDEEMDFSNPYFDSDQSIATTEDSGIKTEADLEGKILGVQIGTTGELEAKRISEEINIAEIKTYDDILLAFEDLKAGRIDAIINDFPTSLYIVKENPGLVLADKIITGEKYGVVFAPDTPELLEAVNNVLREMKEDGTYQQICDTWFAE